MHDRGPGARGLVQDQGDCAERLRLDRQWNQGAYFFYAKHNVRLILCHYNLISNNLSIYLSIYVYLSIHNFKIKICTVEETLNRFLFDCEKLQLYYSIYLSISLIYLSILYLSIPGLRSARPWRSGVPLRDEVELHEQTQGWNKITNMLKLGNKRREEEDEKG